MSLGFGGSLFAPQAWFHPSLAEPNGWFDRKLIPAAAAAPGVTVRQLSALGVG